ncbi:Bacteriophage head to tail connecting protein [compost metagenome]
MASIERTIAFAGSLAGIYPEAVDKLDFDQAIDEYAAMVGVPPTIVRPDDTVAQIRQARADAAEQQQAMEQMGQMIQGAKLLSETDTGGQNALTAMVQP